MDTKAEAMRMHGADLQPGDRLKRINLPTGWPEQVLTVVKVGYEDRDGLYYEVGVSPRLGAYDRIAIFARNIGILYERI